MKQNVIQRVAAVIEFKTNGNEREFARIVGVNPKTLNQHLKGERGISLDVILQILSSFEDISSEWLLRGTGHMLIADNLPLITGDETDYTLTLHAELTRASLKIEELTTQNTKLTHQLEYMETLNLKLAGLVHQLEQQLAGDGMASSKKIS